MLSKPIILTGLSGAGKSVTGRALAEKLSVPFFDTDDLIVEKEKTSISSIFENQGEPYFRQCEKDCIKNLSWEKPFILSTGGGLFVSPENQAFLLEKGFVIWLNVSLEVMKQRLVSETAGRPLLENEGWEAKLDQMAADRGSAYQKAHWTYNIVEEPLGVVVRNVIEKVSS